MFYATNNYITAPGQEVYSLSFAGEYPGYIYPEHVYCTVDGVQRDFNSLIFETPTTVRLSPAPIQGSKVTFNRRTSPTTPLVDWEGGRGVTEANLDINTLQMLYLAQESSDLSNEAKDFTDNVKDDVGDIIEDASDILDEIKDDIQRWKDALSGQVSDLIGDLTADILYQDLIRRIELIEGPTTGVYERLTILEDGFSAVADDTRQVVSTVAGFTTAIETNSQSIDGIHGKYTVKIDNNGYVSGFGLISTDNDGTPSSAFTIVADRFMVVTPGQDPKVPFTIGSVDGVSTIGIRGDMLIDGSIKAAALNTSEIFTMKLNIGHGSTGFNNIADAPKSLYDINPGEFGLLGGDGGMTNWFYPYEPSLNNLPVTSWSEEDKAAHVGDLFYNTATGVAYAWQSITASPYYEWIVLRDKGVTTALQVASTAKDTADGKRRVFTTTPVGPYDVGDMWSQSSGILVCVRARGAGAYATSDWQVRADETGKNTARDTQFVAGIAAATVRNQAAAGATFTSSNARALAYQDAVSKAQLDGSIMAAGGYLRADLINVDTLLAGFVYSGKLMLDSASSPSAAFVIPTGPWSGQTSHFAVKSRTSAMSFAVEKTNGGDGNALFGFSSSFSNNGSAVCGYNRSTVHRSTNSQGLHSWGGYFHANYGDGVLGITDKPDISYGVITPNKMYAQAYTPFTGSHIVFTQEKDYKIGELVYSTDAWCFGVNQSLVTVNRTRGVKDKRVLGVVSSGYVPAKTNLLADPNITEQLEASGPVTVKPEYQPYVDMLIDGEYQQLYVNSLGEGGILVCSDNGDIENGDYLCSAERPGHAMLQDDDLLHNYTVGKALENVFWDDEPANTKFIACTYHCG